MRFDERLIAGRHLDAMAGQPQHRTLAGERSLGFELLHEQPHDLRRRVRGTACTRVLDVHARQERVRGMPGAHPIDNRGLGAPAILFRRVIQIAVEAEHVDVGSRFQARTHILLSLVDHQRQLLQRHRQLAAVPREALDDHSLVSTIETLQPRQQGRSSPLVFRGRRPNDRAAGNRPLRGFVTQNEAIAPQREERLGELDLAVRAPCQAQFSQRRGRTRSLSPCVPMCRGERGRADGS